MSSLNNRIELLENDLKANPPRISVYHDLPFAIFRYDPEEEWTLRREARLLATRLEEAGRKTCSVHMSDLLWKAIQESEGIDAVVELENDRVSEARNNDHVLVPTVIGGLCRLLTEHLQSWILQLSGLLMRAAAMAPGIYHMSKLLDQMQGKTSYTTILFYPGSIEGTTGLRFMALKDRDALGNYRVKIYG